MFTRPILAAIVLGHFGLGSLAAQPMKTNVRFKLWNSSEHVLEAVYISPTSESRWGKNLIQRPVRPGHKFVMLVPGGCGPYDVRFVAPDGIEYMREAVSFCEDDHVIRIGDRAIRKMTAAQAEALEAAAAKAGK